VPGDSHKGKSKKKQAVAGEVIAEKPADSLSQWALIRPLLGEKIPLLAIAALSSIVTYIVQQKGGAVQELPLSVRIANAFVTYCTYIGQTIWPNNLAVFYPHPGSLPAWQVVGAALFLIAVTIAVIWKAKRIPYALVGWFWYAGTLVPVIGIVQVGLQARADRYTYVPLIGLFIMATWGFSELSKNWRYRKEVLVASSTVVLLCLCIVTWTQVRYWQSSITLFEHALNVTADNYIAYNNRGTAYLDLGNYRQAIGDFDKAIVINPNHAGSYYNRGTAYSDLGDDRQAITDFDRAIEINPLFVVAYYNRGIVYSSLGNYRQAIGDYDKAIEINLEYGEAYIYRGIAYSSLGNYPKAIGDYDKAIEINSKDEKAYNNRGGVYAVLGNYQQAIADYDNAIQINPQYAEAYYNRGYAHSRLGNGLQASEDLKTAARLGYENAQKLLKSQGIGW
jgi:tetratricopeptide (TPR) repeat protein